MITYLCAFAAAFGLIGGILTLIILAIAVPVWIALVVMTIRRAR